MARAVVPSSWLPAHQAQALYTAAHIDSTIEQLGDVLHTYLGKDPLQLRPRLTQTVEEVVLVGITPLPQSVPRLFADALNQSRNMLEHALFADVVHRLEREMTEKEAKALEVPAARSREAFEQWCRHPVRRSLGVFDYGAELTRRLERLQPYQRKDSDEHPLRLLVEHTNHAKHREPAVAFWAITQCALVATSVDHRAALAS
ncbi:hypothetical protein [Agromyces sp. H66]|uniref:hypothetical protein n=1 Tax=Agromyces sp. H66 TaxID=2529859 RepID=UPI0010AA1146|nr:hypothetical protein [Agromyces sp. H66]